MAWVAVATAVAGFITLLIGWRSGGGAIDLAWAPTLDLRLNLALDGLGALYALLATGIGAIVFGYAAAYLPLHLKEGHRPRTDRWRFWPWMVVFMAAMVGLACARDLVLLFVFFDLTAIASYFLIAFDRHDREARGAALAALLVTGISAVALLIAAAVLYVEYGTFSLPVLFERVREGTLTTAVGMLILAAAFAKSAQVPLHFWLPRAMVAPTPVSAYLHSAAMVAAGVLVLGRVHPLLARSDAVMDGLVMVGFASIVVGSVLALAQDEIKQILAYSTIAQYGYVVVLYGIGGPHGAGAAAFYVVAHAIAKSALFMAAGAVAAATHESRLSRLGGLGRPMPTLAISSLTAAATLAALPLTMGFFKDELFFATAVEAGPGVQVMAVIAAALTFAYIGRLWLGIFTGPRAAAPPRVHALLVAPVVVLAGLALLAGLAAGPVVNLAEDAGAVTYGGPVELTVAYHLDARTENLMAIAAWAIGGVVLVAVRTRERIVRVIVRAGHTAGPRRVYGLTLLSLNRLSDWLHNAEVRDLRNSIAVVLLPTGVLVAAGVAVTPAAAGYEVGVVRADDLPIIVLLGLALLAALTVARGVGRLRPVLALAVVGFALAAVFAVIGAPDVALVAVVVETVLTLVFVGVFSRLPRADRVDPYLARGRRRRWRNPVVAAVAGVGAFAIIWGSLSRPTVAPRDSAEQVKQTPEAHGGDVVTVILADFRALDTVVEITVLLVAVIGIISLLTRLTAREK